MVLPELDLVGFSKDRMWLISKDWMLADFSRLSVDIGSACLLIQRCKTPCPKRTFFDQPPQMHDFRRSSAYFCTGRHNKHPLPTDITAHEPIELDPFPPALLRIDADQLF